MMFSEFSGSSSMSGMSDIILERNIKPIEQVMVEIVQAHLYLKTYLDLVRLRIVPVCLKV